MATVYKSKFGWETTVFCLIILIPYFVVSLNNNFDVWATIIIMGMLAGIMVYCYVSTTYTVEGNVLLIKSTFFYKKRVDIAGIRKITATSNLMSAPAPSIDRIEIWFKGYDSIMISPKDKAAFVKHLQQINPAIEYVLPK